MDIILSNMAFAEKKNFMPEGIRNLKNKYTVVSKDGDKTVEMFMEDNKYFGIPKQAWEDLCKYSVHYGIAGNEKLNIVDNRSFFDVEFPPIKIGYRENQENLVNDGVDGLKRNGSGGIICAQGGFGKTICALFMIAKIKTRTMIIVNNSFLLDQWMDRIHFVFGENVDIGIIQQDEFRIGNHITIAMNQTLNARESYIDQVKNAFGLIVHDECHGVAAETWYKSASKLAAKYQLGLSATPRRNDGMEKVFFNIIGPIVAKSAAIMPKPLVIRLHVKNHLKEPYFKICPKNRPTIMIKKITDVAVRNKILMDNIVDAVEKGRRPIVLSHRVNHVKLLKQMFEERTVGKNYITNFFASDQNDRDEALRSNVMFATWQKAKQALDVPNRDTLIMATAQKDVEQAIYRIRRFDSQKKSLVVLDIIDDSETLKNMQDERLAYYQTNKFDVKNIILN